MSRGDELIARLTTTTREKESRRTLEVGFHFTEPLVVCLPQQITPRKRAGSWYLFFTLYKMTNLGEMMEQLFAMKHRLSPTHTPTRSETDLRFSQPKFLCRCCCPMCFQTQPVSICLSFSSPLGKRYLKISFLFFSRAFVVMFFH